MLDISNYSRGSSLDICILLLCYGVLSTKMAIFAGAVYWLVHFTDVQNRYSTPASSCSISWWPYRNGSWVKNEFHSEYQRNINDISELHLKSDDSLRVLC